ncbi:DUF1007 family protein [Campylobacter subantarcticus]|uniref:Nickel/cobalt efflux system n=1 Tax=Campylobacter subantarcticus LMG 24374 TaxID=1388751 RepID=A0A0A8H7K6_9BACT|nr:DUF1007 family protein [Campylobacter subantarcticus]AJC89952.1 metal ion ABC transporter, permease protein [Campylobacter subantarcticus LMG 24374]EAJ1260863.1 DUF1007 family protein [Campylobacter lari]
MKIILILAFICFQKVLSCALCAAYTPTANVNLDFNASDNNINQIHVTWEFSQDFVKILLQNYDINYNDTLDKDELTDIKYTLLDYIASRQFLMQFQFYNLDEKIYIEKFSNTKLILDKTKLFFTFEVKLNIPIKENNTFSIRFEDKEGFFNFKFIPQDFITLNSNYYLSANPNLNLIFLQTRKGKVPNIIFAEIQTKQSQSFIDNFLNKLQNFNENIFLYIKQLLQQEFNMQTFLILLIISFGYGVFHASAPGHSKVLTSSYFLTHKSSFSKIFYFVLKIGIIHIMSAFLLVSIGIIMLEKLLKDVNMAGFILTKFTSLLIVFIALFMLSKKILHKNSCSCHTHKTSEWGMILGASLVPCPGVILLFTFAYKFNFLYTLSSVVSVTLGMCFVLFLFAIGANKIHQNIKTTKIRTSLEYLALIFMILFGLFLFINTKEGVF